MASTGNRFQETPLGSGPVRVLPGGFRRHRTCAPAIFLLVSLSGLSGQQTSQPLAERSAEEAFRKKYSKVDAFDYKVTPSGPAGLFFISGNLTPRGGVGTLGRSAAASAQATASEFLREEARLLGLDRPEEELRERARETDRHGRIHVFYTKYVGGLRLDGVDIRVHVEPDGTIFAVNGNLVPIPVASLPAVVVATRGAHLPEDQVRALVRGDLGQEPDILFRTEKVVIASEPFVVWKVDAVLEKKLGRWLYAIDAFSGAILSKTSGLQSLQSSKASSLNPPVRQRDPASP
jgi:hypothetical protein